jgi:hypothetical protein
MSQQDQRLAYEAAQNPPGPGPSAAAHAEREARLAGDEAQLRAGAHPGHDEQTSYHQGQPTVETQMKTHGAPAPRTTRCRRPRLMELYPLQTGLPDLAQLAARGEVSRLYREPRTVAEVLAGALAAMEAQDEAEAYRADPIAYVRAERARRTLWGRLMHGRR